MIRINLLPHKKAKPMEKGIMRLWIGMSALLAFVVVASAVMWFVLNNSIDEKTEKVESLNAELKSLSEQVRQVDEFEKTRKGLEKKLLIIGQLKKQRVPVTKLFNELNKYTTLDDIWFETLDFNNNAFTIRCFGKTRDTLGKYVKSLKGSTVLEGVSETSIDQVDNKDRKGQSVYVTTLSGKLAGYDEVGNPLPKL